MKIMVMGGGVAGAATAIALRQCTPAAVTVYEANPDPAGAVGSFLSLASNGLRALEHLGCLERVQQVGFEVPRQRMWSSSGKLLGDVPRARLSNDTRHSITLRRGDLVEQLRLAAQAAGARIVTGRRLTKAARTGTGVRAEFDQGAPAEADLLVGADGIWSPTREVLDPGAARPQYAGLWSVSGTSDQPADRPAIEPGTFNLVFARRGAFIYLNDGAGRIWWSAQVQDPIEPDLGSIALPALIETFRHEQVPTAILRATTELLRPTLHHVLAPVSLWHDSRIVLTGDAAHPVGSGQGASMAVEDAVELGQRLGAVTTSDAAALEQALAGYVGARRTRTAKMITMANANRDAKTAGPIGRRVNDLIMPFFLRHFFEKNTAWLYQTPTTPVTTTPAAGQPRASAVP